jgi:transposase
VTAPSEATRAKKIRRPGMVIDGGGQISLFQGLAEDSRDATARQAVFRRQDPREIFVGDRRLDEHLTAAGSQKPFVVRRLLAEQDWSAFRAKYLGGGRPPYDPQAMTGLVLFGIMKGESSLRGLEELARTDLGAMWVTGGICPDHSVIGRFILLHAAALEGDFLTELTRRVLKATGTSTETLAGDGTIIAAQASRFGTLKREALAEAAQQAREAASAAAAEKKAEAEAKADQLAVAAATLEARVAAREAKSKPAAGLSLHPDEPEAVVQPQKDKKTFAPSYKPTVLANAARVVVACGVHPTSETAELAAQVDEALSQGEVKTLLLDAGFHTQGVFALSAARGLELLCPEGQSVDEGEWTKQSDKLFLKNRFTYEADRDSYRCPQGERLTRSGEVAATATAPGYVVYASKACGQCPLRAKCTKNRKGRRIKRYAFDAEREAMQAKLATAEARARYRQRQAMVEPVFSHLKEVQDLRRFRRRGLAKVRLEFALHIAAYNLSRVVALAPHLGAAVAALWGHLLLLAALVTSLLGPRSGRRASHDWPQRAASRSLALA